MTQESLLVPWRWWKGYRVTFISVVTTFPENLWRIQYLFQTRYTISLTSYNSDDITTRDLTRCIYQQKKYTFWIVFLKHVLCSSAEACINSWKWFLKLDTKLPFPDFFLWQNVSLDAELTCSFSSLFLLLELSILAST